MKSTLKVLTIVGTRPEIIRLACVMQELDKYVNQIIVHTGQNYDYELNEIFFKELEIRKPDYFMNVDTSSLGNVLGGILIKAEEIMRAERPDAVLILGDTNSSIAGIMAKRLKIPIYHMEAGNRCFDFNVPEEINRKIIDHIADFNLVYTEHARRHLLSEGLQHRRIYLTGSPMYEVLHKYEDRILSSKILEELGLADQKYFVVSAHREENVDNPAHLKSILTVLNTLAKEYDVPVIVSTHPRTRKRLGSLSSVEMDPRVRFLKPFGFFDYVHLEMHSLCSISDSGTISEEAAVMKFPAVTIREAIERPEALDAGSIIMTGLDPDVVLASVALVMDKRGADVKRQAPAEYEVANTAERVVKLVLGTAGLSNGWWGIL
ncbi:MAG: UDP-N-acetylglucosamine 2-epimerase (non-hydrolyzing) [Methanocorpusculum sp.]|uniref:non-hydrolyzing UDP-N-acetylglucosamine 2-epimerase n=1 Tax=Methanocorpusculum sp. TaxID=2058474 RepID=UPI00272751FE|nr:UDP-N-acetylglucosamine 2-epimerase (non-hydrolyzing) [Methanocorpusculum sp.]MDO9523814.1 UDP-N-acetylglucosamine 2-epimerase (non-hydrolyzing) [Methanocorpusculum sp.]